MAAARPVPPTGSVTVPPREMVINFGEEHMDIESRHKAWLMTMDYVQKFDIDLDKDVYYAGEVVTGRVVVVTTENIKVKGVRLTLRGKCHTEWKINKAGERRTVKDDEYYIDDKKVLWGKDKHEDGGNSILPRGNHNYPFEFKLPETALPCSFESKVGHVRYYLRIVMDIPYASPPQGIKYFTIVGPHVDCMEDRYLLPKYAEDKHRKCCFCCIQGPVRIQATLERSAYCCGEHIRVKTEIQNGSDERVFLLCKFYQHVSYYINKGVLGLVKAVNHKIWEYQTESVSPHLTEKQDKLHDVLQVPIAPPTMINVCNLIQIHYTLKLFAVGEQSGDMIHLEFPITIGTVPFRIPNILPPSMQFDVASDSVEGGKYISSEFQLGQVYMGDETTEQDEEILYRPVYSCLPHERKTVTNTSKASKCSKVEAQISVTEVVETSIVPSKTRLLIPGDDMKHSKGLVLVDEGSTSEQWEVVALKEIKGHTPGEPNA